jgi:hypothetical protein
VRFDGATRRPFDANRQTHGSVVRVEQEFGDKRSNQARAQATESSARGLDRPGLTLVGPHDENLCQPTESVSAGSQCLHWHGAQRSGCDDLRDGCADEQSPIRRRQLQTPAQ